MKVQKEKSQSLSKFERKLLSNIKKHGWTVMNVFDEEGNKPRFSYSIGLHKNFQHPEIIIFGLGHELMHSIINSIGDEVKKGQTFEAGRQYAELIDKCNCTFRPVQRKWYELFLGGAIWYYQKNNFPVLQCIWPDKNQFYPWQRDFFDGWKWAQPLLYRKKGAEKFA